MKELFIGNAINKIANDHRYFKMHGGIWTFDCLL